MILTKNIIKNYANFSNQQIEFPKIEPISEGVHRPIWSVMIPTYNRVDYLQQTIKSVLEQASNPEEMQIEVIDNCSSLIDTEALVRNIDQNRVSCYKQPRNVGMIENWNTCIHRARGHLIHIIHDDDLVIPGFYKCLQELFDQEPTIGSAFCRYAFVDENNQLSYLAQLEQSTRGVITDWLERIAIKPRIAPPAIVVRRSVYEKLGGFHPEISNASDWEMWKRIAANYQVAYEPQVLAYYRKHSDSYTSSALRAGQNIIDTHEAIEIARSYLPEKNVERLTSKATEECALLALKHACWSLNRGDVLTTISQISAALKCHLSLKVIAALALLPFLAAMSSFNQYLRKQFLRANVKTSV